MLEFLTKYNAGEKITAKECIRLFREYNEGHTWANENRTPLKAVALFKEKVWTEKMPEEERVYYFDSHNKMFYSECLGYSCFAHGVYRGHPNTERMENELDMEMVEGVVLLPA